ncbi:hypothetical protein MM1S1540310_0021 [Mycobacteroides abscessus subsp. bolletii 1S-154-0310]|uniref:hypothetical protein n=1 Tax=Mycobacteroides abscessus TaxID=36809 RepID=UPI0002682504|nr:hypothetical protein [Mycobacteroides abscessus]EIU58760.1 hypothetical protein MM1S1510930_5453 [Mycobacteroides abscessus subsp. bolletii 1S-151-0930]EIU72309.1 hypothetical protein MM1S1520914_0674 [Mycobacteroides abscessus subsp. bolletii 1S-152-0914]EIU82471.1 hypothetical protein MM1S1530915_0007 [Mycobacteroides abscessus subsp. bolletii 1S-153-0915]EIU85057.1 hypothetical protein MM1S1540310_0021 [Mycobacteroides abscessus subsp. bolletii 1S-154-0310]MBE5479774.1 hypothetical prote
MMKIAMLAAAAAFSVAGALGVSTAATAAADPPPPPVCYANRPSVNAIEQTPCVAPGSVQYSQGIHQPTYGGANPLVPYGTNPLVPYGTNQNNAG